MTKIVIIEDEARAANQLLKVLDNSNLNYKLLASLDSIETSVEWLNDNGEPDLLFCDIQLADGLSFEIFQKVSVSCPIIFTTAFDQYAIQAFKVNSVDYLLKPIKQADLDQALVKYQSTKSQPSINPELLASLITNLQQPKPMETRDGILVKDGAGFRQIAISDILYLYSSDSVTFAITREKRYIISETLDEFLSTVSEQQFYHINRGQVIQKSSIIKLEPYFNHRLKLQLKNPRDNEFIVSRSRTPAFKDWLNR